MSVSLEYVSKEAIYPRFGRWLSLSGEYGVVRYQIRGDLPKIAQEYLIQHETEHQIDKANGDFECDGWIQNEIDANANAQWSWRFVAGLLVVAVMSLAPYRIKYYLSRFKKGGVNGE